MMDRAGTKATEQINNTVVRKGRVPFITRYCGYGTGSTTCDGNIQDTMRTEESV
jgi:hypothetical protein